MHLTQPFLYSLKLTLSQNAASTIYRKSWMDRGSVASAFILATAGLSLSMFSLKQMQSTQQLRHLRRYE
ncbi:uncharacterized protein LOC122509923 [Leptopilina heterotoma]|uniref:uncharacterized protein LOC122509923 n=1 Tax=Leptopilina heterotoma TaxID=63436 RepID=UPI001CA95EDE|nr:uncharacterized protein LOC122509923 [Leptopilina heterotoma]XP_043480185.1 uncharacterized protein LOC122509923 [Leptopilina heterotoma]XP_043480186.1 uncharacterized protein LOC122509923 [Leptopilina heterotoma]XP_043480187.1 uncharacterized protein LOC122509923 [Leptopilina heterotoma]